MKEMTIQDYLLGGAEDLSNASESKSHIQLTTRFGTLAIRQFILNEIVPHDARIAHQKGLIYIHDLDHIGPYCNSIDPTIPLEGGLDLPTLKANPAKHFGSALDHLYSFTMYSQNHFAGAQSMDWFNWFLAPYAWHDMLSPEEMKQELQKFFYNCNQITRTGGKPPFVNCGIRFECPKPLQNRPVVWNGAEGILDEEGKKINYSHPAVEMYANMISMLIMEILQEGMNGIPFTYPLIATSILPDSNFDHFLWQKGFETIAKNGSLYMVNLKPQYMQDDGGEADIVSSQCCRVRVKFSSKGGIWSGGEMGTGSDRIISLNLAACGYLANLRVQDKLEAQIGVADTDQKLFRLRARELFSIIDEQLVIIKEAGLALREMVQKSIYEWGINSWLSKETPTGIKYYNPCVRRLLIGPSFINDMLVHMGYEDGVLDADANMFAQVVIEHIKDIQSGWMDADPSLEWGLEAPPNESSNNYMVRANLDTFKDTLDKYPLSVHGTCIENYEYAPATHAPYHEDIALPDKIRAEAPYHRLCNGGNIFHFWLGEGHPEPDGIRELIERMSETDLGYFALSPTFSLCSNNHATVGRHQECPECGEEITDYMERITGYFERVSRFNDSKKQEWETRKQYSMGDMK